MYIARLSLLFPVATHIPDAFDTDEVHSRPVKVAPEVNMSVTNLAMIDSSSIAEPHRHNDLLVKGLFSLTLGSTTPRSACSFIFGLDACAGAVGRRSKGVWVGGMAR